MKTIDRRSFLKQTPVVTGAIAALATHVGSGDLVAKANQLVTCSSPLDFYRAGESLN